MKDFSNSFKWPRLYVPQDLAMDCLIPLEEGPSHYLFSVLRKKEGEPVRLFNGREGEWLCLIESAKKRSVSVRAKEILRPQPDKTRRIHFYFAPIKKHRMDWMIEKMVELGVTDFHPVLTSNTEVRTIKPERLSLQILEAAEQCERLTLPVLHGMVALLDLKQTQKDIQLYACIERFDAPSIGSVRYPDTCEDFGFIIGPEGGFTREEKDLLASFCLPIDLGEAIYRCETAAIKALVLLSEPFKT